MAYLQPFPISGQFEGLHDEIAADPAAEKRYFTTFTSATGSARCAAWSRPWSTGLIPPEVGRAAGLVRVGPGRLPEHGRCDPVGRAYFPKQRWP